MNRLATRLRAGVAAVALIWLAGCSPDQLAPSVTPTPAEPPAGLRLTPVATVPAVHVPSYLSPVAGTGSRFLIEGETSEDPGRYSLDNGRTWQDAPAELSVRGQQRDVPLYGSFIGYGGIFLGVRQEPQPSYAYTGFQRWDPATGQVVPLPYDLDLAPEIESDDDTPVFPIDYTGALVLLDDGRIFDVSGGSATPVEPRLPDGEGLADVRWSGITRDGRYVAGTAGSRLVLGALTTQAAPAIVAVPGLVDVDVSADRIHYLVQQQRRLRHCRAEAAAPASASCTVVATGGPLDRRHTLALSVSDGAAQISLIGEEAEPGDHDRLWFVRAGRVTLLSRSLGDFRWLPYRDTEAPMARQDGVAVTLGDDGRVSPLFSAPAASVGPTGLAVAADRVVYRQESASPAGSRWPVWVRPLTDAGLGDPVQLADRTAAALYVSGSRTAVQWDDAAEGSNDVVFYDGLTPAGSLQPEEGLRALSGPYARIGDRVVRVDGQRCDTGPVMAHFGSLVVEASDGTDAAGRSFTVRDLAQPGGGAMAIELPDLAGRSYRNADWRIWGDRVAAGYESAQGRGTVLFDYRTGETVDLTARLPLALGDGWALLLDPATERMWLRALATGEEVDAGVWVDVGSDGLRRLAWPGQKDAVVAAVEGLPAPGLRLLGALGASELSAGELPWTPEFDLTGPSGAGTLELADSAGRSVASLPVAATTSGSIRGLSWDGRGPSGGLVEPGTYTWTLAIDGLTSVDGLRPASGELVVSR